MPPLTVIDGVLRVDSGSLVLTTPAGDPCCCYEYTIEICNINSVTDDDWEIELNSAGIGVHSAPEMILAGTVWRTDPNIVVGCGTVTYKDLSKDKFRTGQNMLYMKIVKLYFAANFGTVTVNRWRREGNAFVVDAALLNTTYTGPSQLGFINVHYFNYP